MFFEVRNQTRTWIVFRISGQTQSVKRVQNPQRSREKIRYFNQQKMWLTNIVTKLSSYEVNMIYTQNLVLGATRRWWFQICVFNFHPYLGFRFPCWPRFFKIGLVKLPTREENLSPGKVKFHHRFITRLPQGFDPCRLPQGKGVKKCFQMLRDEWGTLRHVADEVLVFLVCDVCMQYFDVLCTIYNVAYFIEGSLEV